MASLIFEQNIEASNLFVESVAAAQWPTEALGCGEPGMLYDTVGAPFFGFEYVLSDGTNSWEYHASEDDSVSIQCNAHAARSGSKTVNITMEGDLRLTTSATLMRRNFANDQFEEVDPLTQQDAGHLVDIFYNDVSLIPATECVTVFRLDFVTETGTAEIEFMCAEDKNAAQIFWQGMEGRAPVIGQIIGPYFTGGPIPTLPTATP